MSTLSDRYHSVLDALPTNVKLIAVSKTRTVDEIQALYDLGQRAFGENYPQELRDKQPLLPTDIEWHFIGHLQRNKVKYISSFVHLVHAVDDMALLDELQKRALSAERSIRVLLQVHIAREETKHGFDTDEVRALMEGWDPARWDQLVLGGLMGMATNTDDREQVRREFEGLASLHRELHSAHGEQHPRFTELSMGMSGDADLAIAAGSTMVRIGSSIFGPRS
jgi:pyridoxal phosphate enzyme (YggS family)